MNEILLHEKRCISRQEINSRDVIDVMLFNDLVINNILTPSSNQFEPQYNDDLRSVENNNK